MGTWPDPNTGNKTIGIVGPLVDDGGVASELKALGLPTVFVPGVLGKSYYFPFQVYEYWRPFSIAATHTTATGLVDGFYFARSIQFAIYSETGTTTAKQVSVAPIWETKTQTSEDNVHTLSPQPYLPPGSYYVGYQITPTILDPLTNVDAIISATHYGSTRAQISTICGCRESAFPFLSNVTDLTTGTLGIIAGLQVRATFV